MIHCILILFWRIQQWQNHLVGVIIAWKLQINLCRFICNSFSEFKNHLKIIFSNIHQRTANKSAKSIEKIQLTSFLNMHAIERSVKEEDRQHLSAPTCFPSLSNSVNRLALYTLSGACTFQQRSQKSLTWESGKQNLFSYPYHFHN